MSFEDNIKEWVTIDNKIKQLNDQLSDLRENRKDLGTRILQHVTTERLDNATVNISDGSLRFVNTKSYSPLTYKFLQKCLMEYFKDERLVSEFIIYMKNNRENNCNLDIKRYYVNTDEY